MRNEIPAFEPTMSTKRTLTCLRSASQQTSEVNNFLAPHKARDGLTSTPFPVSEAKPGSSGTPRMPQGGLRQACPPTRPL
jgi:hypothetical protein